MAFPVVIDFFMRFFSDVTLSRDNLYEATHLKRLSCNKTNYRKQGFQKYISSFVHLFGTKWLFLRSWPLDYLTVNVNVSKHAKYEM